MSLPDTAEYWWDVKGYSIAGKRVFVHIPNIDCGHFHVHESFDVEKIDCYACKKLLTEELKQSLAIDHEKHKAKEQHKHEQKVASAKKKFGDKNGYCSCGNPFIVKVNHKTKETFLGCYNYPNCKNTKSIIK